MCQTLRKHTVSAPAWRVCDLIHESRVQIAPCGIARGRAMGASGKQRAPAGQTEAVPTTLPGCETLQNGGHGMKFTFPCARRPLPPTHHPGPRSALTTGRNRSSSEAWGEKEGEGMGGKKKERGWGGKRRGHGNVAACPRKRDSCPGKGLSQAVRFLTTRWTVFQVAQYFTVSQLKGGRGKITQKP